MKARCSPLGETREVIVASPPPPVVIASQSCTSSVVSTAMNFGGSQDVPLKCSTYRLQLRAGRLIDGPRFFGFFDPCLRFVDADRFALAHVAHVEGRFSGAVVFFLRPDDARSVVGDRVAHDSAEFFSRSAEFRIRGGAARF